MARSDKNWTAGTLKSRGWNEKLMAQLLPRPRYFHCDGKRVRTWRREYVEAADGLAFSADEGALLQSLESLGPVDVEQLILHTHLSRRSAEDMIVKLAGMGLVEFVYSHQRFMVITNA